MSRFHCPPPTLALLSTLSVIALAACSYDGRRVSGRFHASIAISDRGSLVVSERAGEIQVEAWDKPLVSVDAVEYASDETALRQMHVIVERTADGVSVSTTYAGSGAFMRAGDVDLVIHVPANADLDLSSGAGLTEVSGSRASVKVRTSAGEIDVRMARVAGDQHISLWTTTGEITLRIPQSSSATIDAGVMLGSSTNDFHAARIGGGAARISMHAITGEVELESGG